MQEVVVATLLEKMKTSIESNRSLQMLVIHIEHNNVVDAILKGACRNTSLKKLTIWVPSRDGVRLNAATAAELQQVRPRLELHVDAHDRRRQRWLT